MQLTAEEAKTPMAGNGPPFAGISLEQERHQLGRTGAVIRRDLRDRLRRIIDLEAAGLQFGEQAFRRLVEQRGQLGQGSTLERLEHALFRATAGLTGRHADERCRRRQHDRHDAESHSPREIAREHSPVRSGVETDEDDEGQADPFVRQCHRLTHPEEHQDTGDGHEDTGRDDGGSRPLAGIQAGHQ